MLLYIHIIPREERSRQNIIKRMKYNENLQMQYVLMLIKRIEVFDLPCKRMRISCRRTIRSRPCCNILQPLQELCFRVGYEDLWNKIGLIHMF